MFFTRKQTQFLVWSQRAACTLLFIMAFVWSQRAICAVLFLMAELCRRRVPSMMYVMGVIVLTSYALPSVGCCTIYHLLCVSIWEKTHLLGISKSVRSPPVWLKVAFPSAWLEAAPPSSPLLPASEPVSLPRPCLPRMEMFGGGVIIGEGV